MSISFLKIVHEGSGTSLPIKSFLHFNVCLVEDSPDLAKHSFSALSAPARVDTQNYFVRKKTFAADNGADGLGCFNPF